LCFNALVSAPALGERTNMNITSTVSVSVTISLVVIVHGQAQQPDGKQFIVHYVYEDA